MAEPQKTMTANISKVRSDTSCRWGVHQAKHWSPFAKRYKHRAWRACLSCRARRVRCNIDEETPCSNCRWYNNQVRTRVSISNGDSHTEQLTWLQCVTPGSPTRRARQLAKSQGESGVQRCQDPSTSASNSVSTANSRMQRSDSVPRFTGSPVPLERVGADAQLPPFVLPLHKNFDSEDIEYLTTKGVLTLPGSGLQNELLEAYVEYVHPSLPHMDIHDFLLRINSRDGQSGQVSLLLYHAVMFSGTAFVTMESLKQAGYYSRKCARQAFFAKAKLLYDFGYERVSLELVQALLLICPWYEAPDDYQDEWYWLGIAISTAYVIGLHRDPTGLSIPPSIKRLRKRIWWSCVLLDRHVAMSTDRPMRIKDEDSNVPMLQETDFEFQKLSNKITVISPKCKTARDARMQQELATIFIHRTSLYLCVTHILNAQRSTQEQTRRNWPSEIGFTPVFNKGSNMAMITDRINDDLLVWAMSLPVCCQYRTPTALDVRNGASTIIIQRAVLYMTYYAAMITLHRPLFLHGASGLASAVSLPVQKASDMKVCTAALHITRLATELHHMGLVQFLTNTSLAAIVSAARIHLIGTKYTSLDARARAIQSFRQSMGVIESLRDVYSEAYHATRTLDDMLHRIATRNACHR